MSMKPYLMYMVDLGYRLDRQLHPAKHVLNLPIVRTLGTGQDLLVKDSSC